MSEGIGVTQAPELNSESVQHNSKRKPDSPPLDDPRRVSKTPRLDPDQNPNPNPNPNPEHGLSVENGEEVGIVEKGEEEKETDQSRGHSKDALVDKGKGKMIVQEEEELDKNSKPNSKPYVDKGKGKMIVEEEEEDSSDDSDEACVASGSDSEYSDDPLMEVDLNNILPSRTRRWAPPVPGAYLVPADQNEDDDDDDDDDDADVSDVGADDDDDGGDSDSESE